MCGLVKLFLAALLSLWIYDYLLTFGDEVRDQYRMLLHRDRGSYRHTGEICLAQEEAMG